MITVTFYTTNGGIGGFEATGHSGLDESGKDIVCAAVSSALYMAVNTITEVLLIIAEITVNDDGFMKLNLSENDVQHSQEILKGLEVHLKELEKQYPENIKVVYGGVDNA